MHLFYYLFQIILSALGTEGVILLFFAFADSLWWCIFLWWIFLSLLFALCSTGMFATGAPCSLESIFIMRVCWDPRGFSSSCLPAPLFFGFGVPKSFGECKFVNVDMPVRTSHVSSCCLNKMFLLLRAPDIWTLPCIFPREVAAQSDSSKRSLCTWENSKLLLFMCLLLPLKNISGQ